MLNPGILIVVSGFFLIFASELVNNSIHQLKNLNYGKKGL